MDDFGRLIFEPHGLFGKVIDGEGMPFGYISTARPSPIFELGVPLAHPPEKLRALAVMMAAAPMLLKACRALDVLWTEDVPHGPGVEGEIRIFAPETLVVWRLIRAALAQASPPNEAS